MKQNSEREYGYSHMFEEDPVAKWHVRFGLTPNCNFSCTYCAPEGGFPRQEELNLKEISEILQGAYNNGIKRVHWTGGEPTMRRDFRDCVEIAKQIGYEKQIVTTNGYNLYKNIDQLIERGLSRVVVSLDTLKKERFFHLTGKDILHRTLNSLEACVDKLPNSTKVSCCTMRSTLPELGDFINYASNINENSKNGSLVLKFNQFFASNPAQLQKKGRNYWENEIVSYEEIIAALKKVGNLEYLARKNVEGDNPSYSYYNIEDKNIILGILSMHTNSYSCGGCHKLRITPIGEMSVCMDTNKTINLNGLNVEEKTQKIKEGMYFRDHILDSIKPIEIRKHFNPQLGSQRFGDKPEIFGAPIEIISLIR